MDDFWSIIAFDKVTSTNEIAKKFIEEGAAHEGTVIWAREQTEGRGRRDKKWISHSGNLFCSAVLEISCDRNKIGQYSFISAMALVESLKRISSGLKIECKWPNDILINNKKVAGILIETTGESAKSYKNVIIGTGINIKSAPKKEDSARVHPTSLNKEGIDIPIKDFLTLYLNTLLMILKEWESRGFDAIRHRWISCAKGIGEFIRIDFGKKTMSGVFVGIDDDGALLLRLSDGKNRRMTAGEIHFLGNEL